MQKKLGIVVVAALPAVAKTVATPRPGLKPASQRAVKLAQAKAA